jgi:hypothetical protein
MRVGEHGGNGLQGLASCLKIAGLCSLVVLALAAAGGANASTTVPKWFVCAKAAKSGSVYTGDYGSKTCTEASKESTGKYELVEGLGKGKALKGKSGRAVLDAKTLTGDETIECSSSKSIATPSLPNLETDVSITYKHCMAPSGKACSSTGAHSGEITLAGLQGKLGYVEEAPTSPVSLTLESAAHPGGQLAQVSCEGLEGTVSGVLRGVQGGDINVVSKQSETTFATQDQTIASKGEALMIKAGSAPSEPTRSILIGEIVEHENAGDAKEDEITPIRFVAAKSGTIEELFFETGGYLYHPVETSLVLGVQEQVGGKPGKVLGEGTYTGKLGENEQARVGGLKVPIVKGHVYYLTFLPLGGAITYWYSKAETILYSIEHTKLTEGPPENYEWREELHEAPIGMWAVGH